MVKLVENAAFCPNKKNKKNKAKLRLALHVRTYQRG
jgi:hypothetical protein